MIHAAPHGKALSLREAVVSRFVTGKRKKRRTKMVVPVRVRLAGNNTRQAPQLAHTLDANESGVKLVGFRGDLNVGDVIEIQHRHERAMFRVVWIRLQEKCLEKHIGAECVEPDKNIWGQEFPHQTDEYEETE
jgi:hypothetical protein